jgi:hypothetical protein
MDDIVEGHQDLELGNELLDNIAPQHAGLSDDTEMLRVVSKNI